MKRLIFLLLLITLYLSTTYSTYAQGTFPWDNEIALKGVDKTFAYAVLTGWMDVDNNQVRFESNLNSAFKLGLRREGVIVDMSPNHLICEVRVAQGNGIIIYTLDIQFYKYNIEGMHNLIWSDSNIVKIGTNNFNSRDVAQKCVDMFSSEWLKQNPRR